MSFYSQTSYIKSESSFYNPIYGNYKFDTDLTNFGLMLERRVRKINRTGSVLKLQKNSIYPMLDEFGYTFMDFFIFRSTWDQGYHFESVTAKEKIVKYVRNPKIWKDVNKVESLIKSFEKDNFNIGRSYVSAKGQNNFE